MRDAHTFFDRQRLHEQHRRIGHVACVAEMYDDRSVVRRNARRHHHRCIGAAGVEPERPQQIA
jgi:hypothetical protein